MKKKMRWMDHDGGMEMFDSCALLRSERFYALAYRAARVGVMVI